MSAETHKVETQEYTMTTTHLFDAPLDALWRAWSDAEQVMRWWGPTGFTSPICKMDFREGGTTLVCMAAPAEYGGQEMYNTWSYSRIVPQERIEFASRFSDAEGKVLDPAQLGLPPGIPMSVPHVITFKEVGGGKTELTVTEYGYTNAEITQISKAGMDQCLEKMAASLSGARA
jgi:uncharacterized protein YndB with AHSA1/START domain